MHAYTNFLFVFLFEFPLLLSPVRSIHSCFFHFILQKNKALVASIKINYVHTRKISVLIITIEEEKKIQKEIKIISISTVCLLLANERFKENLYGTRTLWMTTTMMGNQMEKCVRMRMRLNLSPSACVCVCCNILSIKSEMSCALQY